MANHRKDKDDLAWAKAFDRVQKGNEVKPTGDGWITISEIRKMIGYGENRTYTFVSKGIENGLIERFDGLAKNASGKLVRKIWYRLISRQTDTL